MVIDARKEELPFPGTARLPGLKPVAVGLQVAVVLLHQLPGEAGRDGAVPGLLQMGARRQGGRPTLDASPSRLFS